MAESADSLLRRGAISSRAYTRMLAKQQSEQQAAMEQTHYPDPTAEAGRSIKAATAMPGQALRGAADFLTLPQRVTNAQGETVFPANGLERWMQGAQGPQASLAASFLGGPGAPRGPIRFGGAGADILPFPAGRAVTSRLPPAQAAEVVPMPLRQPTAQGDIGITPAEGNRPKLIDDRAIHESLPPGTTFRTTPLTKVGDAEPPPVSPDMQKYESALSTQTSDREAERMHRYLNSLMETDAPENVTQFPGATRPQPPMPEQP